MGCDRSYLCKWEATTECDESCQCYDAEDQTHARKLTSEVIESVILAITLYLITPFIIVWIIASAIDAVIERIGQGKNES